MQATDYEVISERIDRLEQRYDALKRLDAIVLVVVASLAVSAYRPHEPSLPSMAQYSSHYVGRSFSLVDSLLRPRMKIDISPDTQPRLVMWGQMVHRGLAST